MKWIKYIAVIALAPIWVPAILVATLIAFEPSEWKNFLLGRCDF